MILKRVVKIFAAVLLLSVLMTGAAFAQIQPQIPLQNQQGGDWQRQYQEGIAIQDMRHTWFDDGSSRLEISLSNPRNEDIKFNVNQRVIVRDRNGNTYNTRVIKAERNLIQLVIEKLRSGENYSFEIQDVYFRGTNNTVRGDFKAEDNWTYGQQVQQGIEIQQMRYNRGRLEIRLYNPNNENIRWNKTQPVLVRDRSGRTTKAEVLRAENNMIELKIDGLRYGQTYSVEIGVDNRGGNSTVRGDFKAEDNWTYGQQGQQGIEIQQMRYNRGRLEIRLYNRNNENIRWNKNQPILVRDRNGRDYDTKVLRIGRDMIEIKIEGLRYGQTYSVQMGVEFKDRKYTVKGDFKAEDNWTYGQQQEIIQIQQMRYNKGRLEIRLNIPDNDNIRWNKNQPVLVRERNGKTIKAEVLWAGPDMIQLKIEGLRYGQTYSVEMGIEFKDRKYTVKGDFKAEDNWKYSK